MKTAIVTGATRGVGRATAIALGRIGYHVVVTGRTQIDGDMALRAEAEDRPDLAGLPGSLASTVESIEAAGGRGTPIVLDLLDRDCLQPAAAAAIAALGQVDVLLNNAIYVGPGGLARYLDTPSEELERRLYANVTAQLVFTQPVLHRMVEHGVGVIANVTSGAGYLPVTAAVGEGGWALSYGVSKAGLHRIVPQLAAEHPEITFLNLQPGFVATERVLASAADTLAFVARNAVSVEVIGTTMARILDEAASFDNGANVQVQDIARSWGLL